MPAVLTSSDHEREPESGTRTHPVWVVAANAILYQAVWFACVFGGNRIGLPAAAAGLAIHFTILGGGRRDAAMIATTLGTGLLADSLLMHAGIYRFMDPAGPFCPLWFLAIWTLFGTLFGYALRWLIAKPLAAALLGAVGGPLAYHGGAKTGALVIRAGLLPTLLMAAVWCGLMVWLTWVARKLYAPGAGVTEPGTEGAESGSRC